MNYFRLEDEILSSVKELNGHQKAEVLDYIQNVKPTNHNTNLYRRRAMKQIRQALSSL